MFKRTYTSCIKKININIPCYSNSIINSLSKYLLLVYQILFEYRNYPIESILGRYLNFRMLLPFYETLFERSFYSIRSLSIFAIFKYNYQPIEFVINILPILLNALRIFFPFYSVHWNKIYFNNLVL